MMMNRQLSSGSGFIPASVYLSSSAQDLSSSSDGGAAIGIPLTPPVVPLRGNGGGNAGRLRNSHSENNKENNNLGGGIDCISDMATISSSLGSLTGVESSTLSSDATGSVVKPISVKERTQRFNRMASEVDLLGSVNKLASSGTDGMGGTSTAFGNGQQQRHSHHRSKVIILFLISYYLFYCLTFK